jgi:hypothetical protein
MPHQYVTLSFSFKDEAGETVTIEFKNTGPRVTQCICDGWIGVMRALVEEFNTRLGPGQPAVNLEVLPGVVAGSSNWSPRRIIDECLAPRYAEFYVPLELSSV